MGKLRLFPPLEQKFSMQYPKKILVATTVGKPGKFFQNFYYLN